MLSALIALASARPEPPTSGYSYSPPSSSYGAPSGGGGGFGGTGSGGGFGGGKTENCDDCATVPNFYFFFVSGGGFGGGICLQ